MIPGLVRFYGGDPVRWLTAIPMALVRAHAAMLPRLAAEESLLAVRRLSVGTGHLRADRVRSAIRGWETQARPHGRPARAQKASPHLMRGAGIGIRRVAAVKG